MNQLVPFISAQHSPLLMISAGMPAHLRFMEFFTARAENRPGRPWPVDFGNMAWELPHRAAGKRPGTRNRATLAAEVLLDGEADTLTRKVIQLAKQGDITALRVCLDRILPPRRERPVQFKLPALRNAGDAAAAMAAIAEAVAGGELTMSEAAELSKLVECYARTLEVTEFDQRIRALEARENDRPEA